MYKQILVPVDGSDTSNRALKEAINLAKEQQATLRLIHVVDETTVYMMADTPYPIADYLKMIRESGQKVLSTCAKRPKKPESRLTRSLWSLKNYQNGFAML